MAREEAFEKADGLGGLHRQRAFSVEQQVVEDPQTGEQLVLPPDRDEIAALVDDIVTTMLRMGGMATLGVRRVPTGDVGGTPTFDTTSFIAIYNTAAPSETPRRDGEPQSLPTGTEAEPADDEPQE